MIEWAIIIVYGTIIFRLLYCLQMQTYEIDKMKRTIDILLDDNLKLHARTKQANRDIADIVKNKRPVSDAQCREWSNAIQEMMRKK